MLPSVRASTETMIMPFQKYSIYAASDAKLTLRGVMTMREKAAEPHKRPFLSVILDNDRDTNITDKRRCLSGSRDKRPAAALKRVHFSRDLVSCIVEDTTGDQSDDTLHHDLEATWYSENDYVQFQLACRETVHLAQSSLQRTGDWSSLDLHPDQHTLLGLENFLSTDREQARLERVRHHCHTMLHKVKQSRRRQRLHRRNCATQASLAEAIRCIPLDFSL
jgi:hypothetical protein